MNLRKLMLPLVVLAIGSPGAVAVKASEAKKPITSWTCADFLGVDEQFRPKVVYAATALSKGEPKGAIIDIDGTEKVAPMIAEECEKTPQSSFLQKLKTEWTKVEADAKADVKKLEKKL